MTPRRGTGPAGSRWRSAGRKRCTASRIASGRPQNPSRPRREGDMTEYLIAFNEDWLPDLPEDDLREASRRVTALRAEMNAAGVLIFTGGLDDRFPVFSVDASSGTPVFSDGPYVETKEHL